MNRDINRFQRGEYDVIVVGGGINGAAIANITSKNNLKVALLERQDFAAGTSSKSTKLSHGGIRYLENLEIDLVRESLKERFIQLKSAPHLVKPLPFIIPVYKNDSRPLWMVKLGVGLYDFLSGRYRIGPHRSLTKDELIGLEPAVNPENLVGGILYYDAQMDDARLCLENVLTAAGQGTHAANYVEVTDFLKENGKAVGVKAFDLLGHLPFTVRAKKIVCAAGPWTNLLSKMDHPSNRERMRLTKGVHLVYPGRLTQHALVLTSGGDRRIFFAIPWMGQTLIGTTDTDYTGFPDAVGVEPRDVEYLLGAAKRFFPKVDFKEEEILSTFAGLRPLVHQPGQPSSVSRKHLSVESFSGMLLVIGGKYTTYRKIAEDCVNKITKVRKDEEFRLYGSGTISEEPEFVAQREGVPVETARYLMDRYGVRYSDVLKLTKNNPDLKKPLCSCSEAIAAQAVYSIQTEMARKPEDVIRRRLGIGYLGCKTKQCEKTIERFFTVSGVQN